MMGTESGRTGEPLAREPVRSAPVARGEANMQSTSTHRPRVLILGAGFAGVAAMKALKGAPVGVTLVDRNGYNTFQPLLYQVATGGLNPGDVTYAARALIARQRNASFRRGAAVTVDFADIIGTLV